MQRAVQCGSGEERELGAHARRAALEDVVAAARRPARIRGSRERADRGIGPGPDVVELGAGNPQDPATRGAHAVLPLLLVAVELACGVEGADALDPGPPHAEVGAPADAEVGLQERDRRALAPALAVARVVDARVDRARQRADVVSR